MNHSHLEAALRILDSALQRPSELGAAAANIELARTQLRLLRSCASEAANADDASIRSAFAASCGLTNSRQCALSMDQCWQCGQTAEQAGLDKMMFCSLCRQARYCSKECQKQVTTW